MSSGEQLFDVGLVERPISLSGGGCLLPNLLRGCALTPVLLEYEMPKVGVALKGGDRGSNEKEESSYGFRSPCDVPRSIANDHLGHQSLNHYRGCESNPRGYCQWTRL